MALRERLHDKGWTSAEIEHAMYHMNLAEQRKHPFVKFTESSTYWLLMLAVGVTILAFSELMFPFLAALPMSISVVTVAIIGLMVGVLFGHVLHDLDNLTHNHHYFTLAFAAVLTIVLAWKYILFAIIFVVAFSLQYVYHWWVK